MGFSFIVGSRQYSHYGLAGAAVGAFPGSVLAVGVALVDRKHRVLRRWIVPGVIHRAIAVEEVDVVLALFGQHQP